MRRCRPNRYSTVECKWEGTVRLGHMAEMSQAQTFSVIGLDKLIASYSWDMQRVTAEHKAGSISTRAHVYSMES